MFCEGVTFSFRSFFFRKKKQTIEQNVCRLSDIYLTNIFTDGAGGGVVG
jgi:hypothetical protein